MDFANDHQRTAITRRMNPNTAPLINEHRAPKGAGRRECSIHHDARYGQNVCPDCNQRMDLVCDPLGNRDYYVCFPCCEARKEAATLRELAEGMAEICQRVSNYDINGIGPVARLALSRYRAACLGEGK
jgi:hypothetical protein